VCLLCSQVTSSWSSADLVRVGVPAFLLEEIYAAMGKVRGGGGRVSVCVCVGGVSQVGVA